MKRNILHAASLLPLMLAVLLTAGAAGAAAQDSVPPAFPAVLDLGAVGEGTTAASTFSVSNDSGRVLFIEFLPTCDCLSVEPGDLTLNPGASADVKIVLDTTGYRGKLSKDFRISSSEPRYHGGKITVRANVGGAVAAETVDVPCTTCKEIEHLEALKNLSGKGTESILFGELFFSEGCRECEAFLADDFPSIRESSPLPVYLKLRNIMDDDDFTVFLERTEALGLTVEKFPALVMDGKAAEGVPAIKKLLEDAIAATSTGTRVRSADPNGGTAVEGPTSETGAGGRGGPSLLLGFVPVFTAGLIDGINPCAFSTLIFLVSVLTVYGRTRKEVLLTGAVFAASVFVTYYLVGLGAFTALRSASSFPVAAAVIRLILTGILFFFAALSVYDGFLARAGRTDAILLQLPLSMKRRIHKTVHHGMKSASLLAGTIGMGVLVSVFELACTGQVYLPTIAWMVAEGNTRAYGLLALYNAAFILPLLGVFLLTYAGISSKKLSGVFSAHVPAVKFALAGVFVTLGVLTILF